MLSLMSLIAVVVVILIGVLIVVIVNRKNKERLDRIVEGKENGRHSNLPEVGTTIKGVSTALIIIFLCIIMFSIIGLYTQLDDNIQMLNQRIHELHFRIDDLEDVIREFDCPYMDAQMDIASYDESKHTATINYSLKLKESSEDTEVRIEYCGKDSFYVNLERTEGATYVGTLEVDVFDIDEYEASLNITTDGFSKVCSIEMFNLDMMPLQVYSLYWLNNSTTYSYNEKKNEITCKGLVEATKSTGMIDNVDSVYLVFKMNDEEIERIQIDDKSKNEEYYSFTVDKKFADNNFEMIIETKLTNGYKFQSKNAFNFGTDMGSFADTMLLINPEGVVIAGY